MDVKLQRRAVRKLGTVNLAASPPVTDVAPFQAPSRSEALALFDHARQLAARDRDLSRPLRGKNLASLKPAAPYPALSPLQRAAEGLGAQVAHVDPGALDLSDSTMCEHLARLLGRLYDAIDCGTMEPTLARRIRHHAGIPVYDGLGLDGHWTCMLADLVSLHAHGAEPGPGGTPIRLVGDAGEARAELLVRTAASLGYLIQAVAPEDEPRAGALAFMIDATNAAHWALHAPDGPVGLPERGEALERVLQAVLLRTMAKA